MPGNLSAFTSLGVFGYPIPERSEATPGLFNQIFSGLSANLDRLNSDVSNIVGSSVGTTESVLGFSSNTIRSQSGNTIFALPYSTALVSKSIDSGGAIFNVRAFGALGDGTTDDTTAIASAITAAVVNTLSSLSGGIVYFPSGKYIVSAPIVVPVAINQGGIALRGAGMRASYLYPNGNASTYSLGVIRFGAAAPDASQLTANQNQYCGMEDISLSGSVLNSSSTQSCIGVSFVEMQYGWMKNCIIELLPNRSIGLYLLGSTFTGGLTGSVPGPHTRLCHFTNVVVTTIGTNNAGGIPLVLQNADENDFFNCSFSPSIGQSAATDSIYAAWIQMGRNNRFFGCLYTGETSSLTTGRPAYDGLVFGPPQNSSTSSQGAVVQNQDYGCVSEGFNIGVWFKAEPGGNLRGNGVWAYNPSICASNYSDQNAATGGFGNYIFSPLLTANGVWYYDGSLPVGNFVTAVGATANVGGTNFPAVTNASNTTLSHFSAQIGQFFFAKIDSNTTIVDASQAGGNDIRLWGRQNWVGVDTGWMGFIQEPSFTRQLTPFISANLAGTSWVLPAVIAAPVGTASAPAFAFNSEQSLGLYRSTASAMNLSYGTFIAPRIAASGGGSAAQPAFTLNSGSGEGLFDAGSSILGIAGGATAVAYVYANQFNWAIDGTALLPANGYFSERSLGWQRSASSTIALSYGTLDLTSAVASISSLRVKSGTNNSCGTAVLGSNGSVNVANTYVKTGDLIFLTDQSPGGTLGDLEVGGIRNSSGFTIQSTSVTDTSTVAWLIVRPG